MIDGMPSARRRAARAGVVVVTVGVLAGGLALFWGPVTEQVAEVAAPCSVVVDGERIGLDRDEARAATAAAAGGGSTESPPGDGADPSPDDGTDPPPEATTSGPDGSADGGDGIPDGVVEAIRAARVETALTCRTPEPVASTEELTDTGLTPRAQSVLDELQETFGDLPTGGFAPGGIDSGHGAESTHYDGRAVDVFFRPVTEASRDEGWLVSQWLVARADELTVQYVIYDDHWWGARQSGRGWQPYRAPGGSDDPVLRHLDHVHVDVVRGGA